MIEVAALLLIIVGWLGYRGYLAICDYMLEKVVIMLQTAIVVKAFTGLLR